MELEKLPEGTEPEKKLKDYITPSVKAVAFVIEKWYGRSGWVWGTNLEEEQDVYQAVSDNPGSDNSFFGSRFWI